MASGKPSTRKRALASKQIASIADKNRSLQIVEQAGKTRERMLAEVVAQGLVGNASTAMRFMKPEFGDLSLTDMVAAIRKSGEAINQNDMEAAEQMLYAQTIALNAIFGEMARISQANMFTHLDAMDRYMRLALRAQSQSRMTVETLAALKNPPVVFARQANIAHGPQQVNNHPPQTSNEGSRTGETQLAPNRLLEESDVKRLDTGAQGSTGRTHTNVASVGPLNGAKKRSG